MSEMWNISSNPHIRDKRKSSDLMLLVLIALIPAAAFGVVNFGINALKVIILSMASSVLTEYIYEKRMHKNRSRKALEKRINDFHRLRREFHAIHGRMGS